MNAAERAPSWIDIQRLRQFNGTLPRPAHYNYVFSDRCKLRRNAFYKTLAIQNQLGFV